jgi:hypothetical protein
MSSDERARAAASLIRERVTGDLPVREQIASRHRFVERALALRGRPRSRASSALALASLVVAVSVVVAIALMSGARTDGPAALTFVVGPDRSPGVIGAYFVPVGPEPFSVNFSDGTVVELAAGARARVSGTTARGASMLVESGTVRADVVHRPASEWTIVAGPYTVRVTGTSFSLSWDPFGALEIQMRSGAVLVRGPGAEAGVVVRGKQRFVSRTQMEVVESEGQNAFPSPSTASSAPSAGMVSDILEASPGLRQAERQSPTSPAEGEAAGASKDQTAARAPAEVETWTSLVAEARYRDVVSQAEQRGVDATIASANEDDLAALGDAARFLRRASLAERALLALRARYPMAPRARSVSYLLGRMADDAGNAAQAIRWYDQYLAESPTGALAAEAFGRRMLALRTVGDPVRSRQAAGEYLHRFPDGSYAGVAREMVAP